jgi:mannosyl-3-phosphoglycerate synthase
MLIERKKVVEHLGAVRIHEVRRLLELDSGSKTPADVIAQAGPYRIGREVISAIQRKMAIVLPIKDEDIKVFEGVLTGIPRDCQIIVVSNSKRGEIDNLKKERETLELFCNTTKRNAIIVHQKDPFIAKALAEAGYKDMLGDDGLVRNGKAEGMILGIVMAMLLGDEYIGFIDTDNYVPGAVWEYAQHYAIGFNIAESPYAIVRILWKYKPKISGEMYFKKWGRVSEITNRYVNNFISTKGKFETDVIKTANAGEHAMSLALATKLTYATGYGVETQELMAIFEQAGGLVPVSDKDLGEKGVDIIQTESINPHIHEERGEDHLIQDMLMPSLSVIYHNRLCDESTKQLIVKQLTESECMRPGDEVKKLRMIPPPETMDFTAFTTSIAENLKSYIVPSSTHSFLSLPSITQKEKTAKNIVVTDLDGTLLDAVSYSYGPALDSLRKLQESRVPIVFCSAKNMAEQQVYRQQLGVKDPFIIENGSAIVIPKDYFHFPFAFTRTSDEYQIIEIGSRYQEVIDGLQRIYDAGQKNFICFGNLTVEEVSKHTGLNLEMAALVKKREYSETVIIQGTKKEVEATAEAIRHAGLNCTHGGRFYEVFQGSDKGKATKILLELFKLNFNKVFTIGLGDGPGDTAMLEAVDLPMLVQTKKGHWNKVRVKNIKNLPEPGPAGWALGVAELFRRM